MNSSADIVPLEEERARRAADDAPHGDSPSAGGGQQGAGGPALDTPGAMLKAARLEARLTTEQVSAEINVKPERIEAIEAMRVSDLPAAPYTLGFVRSYAAFLELPAEPLVQRFREAAGYEETGQGAVTTKIAPPPRDLGASRELSLFAVLGVVGFILWCAWKIVQAIAPEDAAAPPEGSPIAARTTVPELVYEVDGALGVAAGRAPERGEAPAATLTAMPEETTASEGAQEAPTARDEAADRREERGEAQAMPQLVPLPVAQELPGETAAGEEPVAATPAPEAGPSLADVLNREALGQTDESAVPAQTETQTQTQTQTRAEIPAGEAVSGPAARGEAAAAPQEASRTAESAPAVPAGGVIGAADRPGMPVVAQPAPGAGDAAAAAGGENRARLVQPVAPVYPSRCDAIADDVEVVTVGFDVSRFGKVLRPSVIESSNACFDNAALSAVSRFAFEPATQNGRAVADQSRSTRVVFRRDR